MFPAHVLIVRRANKLIIKFSASSWLILINKYIEMHCQQNIKKRTKVMYNTVQLCSLYGILCDFAVVIQREIYETFTIQNLYKTV
jgi:hypothetical protein